MRRILLIGGVLIFIAAGLLLVARGDLMDRGHVDGADTRGGGTGNSGFFTSLEKTFFKLWEEDGGTWLECVFGVPISWFGLKPGEYLIMSRLGWFYEFGPCFFRDPERAVALYRPRVGAGQDTAAFLLGRFYLEGLGVEKNVEKATKLFDLGALHWTVVNDHRVSYLREFMFWRREVPPELMEAIRRAGRLDSAEYFRLAEAVFHGADGMPRDPALARTLYEKVGRSALPLNYAVAHKLIDGSLPLRDGETRRQQIQRGLDSLFYIAIIAQNRPAIAKAQQDIARFVEEGKGVDPDPFFAFEFYTLAQRNGLDTGADIERVRALLTPEKIAEAENDIRTYMYQVRLEFHRKFYYWK